MSFPVELARNPKGDGLMLKCASLDIFNEQPITVPKELIVKLGFFNVTSETSPTIQEIKSALKRSGIRGANAYIPIITRKSVLYDAPIQTTSFQSYKIPDKLYGVERAHMIALATAGTS